MVFWYDISDLKHSMPNEFQKGKKDDKYVKDKCFNAYIIDIINKSVNLKCQTENGQHSEPCGKLLTELHDALMFLSEQYLPGDRYVKKDGEIVQYQSKAREGMTPLASPDVVKHKINSTQEVFCIDVDMWRKMVDKLNIGSPDIKDTKLNVFKKESGVELKCLTKKQAIRVLIDSAQFFVESNDVKRNTAWLMIQKVTGFKQKIVFGHKKDANVGDPKVFKSLKNVGKKKKTKTGKKTKTETEKKTKTSKKKAHKKINHEHLSVAVIGEGMKRSTHSAQQNAVRTLGTLKTQSIRTSGDHAFRRPLSKINSVVQPKQTRVPQKLSTINEESGSLSRSASVPISLRQTIALQKSPIIKKSSSSRSALVTMDKNQTPGAKYAMPGSDKSTFRTNLSANRTISTAGAARAA